MGEIATWSAVKTKVGLGKDSNECPTKAELLALSPTGTGENYVGLEISNASSYGNNETVQLSDIHKVTYRYAFTVVDTVLNFPALGGYSTPRGFGLGTTKQKQIDGVAIGDTISVGYTQSAYPDWIVYDEGYKASGNTTLNQRSASLTFTQNESGKQITVQFTQDAGVETWEYTFTSKNNSLVFNAIGGKGTPTELTITSNKQKYINGKAVGSPVNVDYSRPSLPSWLSVESGYYEALENKSESSRSYTDTLTQAESGKKLTPVLSQAAGVKTYGTPTVYLGSIADIPASGGTAATPTYTYSQLWGWNGKTDDGGTISSGASVVWSENISGSNLGTTAKARTKLGSRTLTVTLNGKSGNASIDIYQAENKITNVTQGTWVVSISANPSTFTEQGGTSQISASARASRTNHWSSGATSAASDATGTPTLSIPTAVTGFSLSGTTLTVAENTTANQRSVVVRATMDTVYKEVTVTQSEYLVEWVYTMTTTQPTLNFDALGTMQTCTITSYREKYINGSLVEGSMEGVNIRVKSSNAYIASTGSPNIREITMFENKTTNSRVGEVVYEQYDSGKTLTITCNQAAGTVAIREELVIKESFPTASNTGGTIKALVRSGYWDVINGKDTVWHDDTPTVKTKPSFVTSTDVTYELNVGYRISATMPANTSESQLSGSLNLAYGSKTLSLGVKQAAASIGYNYYFDVISDFPSVAAAGATPKAVIKSRRYRVVNGVEESSYTLVDVSLFSKPDWIGVLSFEVSSTTDPGADYDVTLPVYENTSESVRNGAVVLQQSGSNKRITLLINQSPVVVTWDYTFSIYSPSSKILNVPAKTIDPDTIICNSYRTKVVNGTQTSTKEFVEVTIDTPEENWLEVTKNSNDMTQAEFSVTCLENKVSSIRSATVTLRQVGSNKLDQVDINQSAATISTRYEISWTANYSNGTVEENVTEVELEGTTGMENSVRMDLHILEYTSINGVEGTPTSWDSRTIAENNSAITSPSGQVSATLQSDSENAFIGISNSVQNLSEYSRTHTITLYNPKVVINGKEVGTVPTITLLVNPVPYQRIFIFGWKGSGNTNTNIILNGDIMNSDSVASRDIISYASLQRNNVEFAKKYIKPTLIPPSEDWLQVIDNGQNSDNSYNYAIRALTNNDGESARSQSVRFEQPGNGNQALYAYVSQDPRDEGYLEGRVNNNGPRTIRLNTVKDEQFLGNINIQAGNFYGLGTLAQDAITIEVNVSVAGTDSSTYTQQVELSNLRFSESGRPVTISNDPNQNTDYEYSWELYPNADVPASFTVKISMLSSDGDNDNGIRLDIIKKNTAVFPIGTLIGDLTLTPKDPTKLPILLCAVYHRYFT